MNKKLLSSGLLLAGLLFAQASHAILIGLLKADNTPVQGEVIGNKLFLVNGDGKKIIAPDGTYRKEAGNAIIVQGGLVKSNGQKVMLNPQPLPPGSGGTKSLGPKQDDPAPPPPADKTSSGLGGAGSVMLNPQPLPPMGGGDKSKPSISPGGLPGGGLGATSIGPKQDDPAPPPPANKTSSGLGGAGNVMLNPQPLPPKGSEDKSKPSISPGGLPARGVGATSIGPKQDDPAPPPPANRTGIAK